MGKTKKSKRYSSSSGEESNYYQSKRVKSKRKKKSYSSSSEEEKLRHINETRNRNYKYGSSSSSDSASSSDTSDEGYTDKRKKGSTPESDNSPHATNKAQNLDKQGLNAERDSWMNLHSKFPTISNSGRKREQDEKKRLEREKRQYDPRTCTRELNPYWKHGGDGLPTFKKPEVTDFDVEKSNYNSYNKYTGISNWRKKKETENFSTMKVTPSTSSHWKTENYIQKKEEDKKRDNVKKGDDLKREQGPLEYTERDLNVLGAKLVKAEIMGNTKLAQELKEKLEKARNNVVKSSTETEEFILTETGSKGQSRPLKLQSDYGDTNKHKRKKKVETHQNNQRIKYFADDDKYSLKQMFENEKFSTGADGDKEFLKVMGKIRKNDDLDDIFSDKIRQKESSTKKNERNRNKAVNNHHTLSQSLENCPRCLQSETMLKHLMVSMGETTYLSLPSFEPLTDGHCMINPVRHTPCATHLDENEWSDILDVRKSLVKMFAAQNKTVIFFECSMSFYKHPHMVIECIPIPKEEGDMAPIYFKKAIDESEIEWSQNKKLVSLKGRDVRLAIPRGLTYFSVSFGMEEGFAHVIEDERLFPINFAQEVIGGMLDLNHSKWRKPKRQSFQEQSKRVVEFSSKWKHFDCFVNY